MILLLIPTVRMPLHKTPRGQIVFRGSIPSSLETFDLADRIDGAIIYQRGAATCSHIDFNLPDFRMMSAIRVIALVLSGVLFKPAVLRLSGYPLPEFIRVPGDDISRVIFPAECRQEIRQVRSVLECSVLCGQSGLDCVVFIAYIHTNRLVSCEMLSCWFDAPPLVEVTPMPTLQLPYRVYARGIGCILLTGTTLVGGRCYQLYKIFKSYINAMEACKDEFMILAEPDTVYQAHALLAWLEQQNLAYNAQVLTNLLHENGSLSVPNGTKLPSHLWATGQPDGDSRCVTAMRNTEQFRFNDYSCSDIAYYVCERGAISSERIWI